MFLKSNEHLAIVFFKVFSVKRHYLSGGVWQKALITPIFKSQGKDPKDPKSYRPVSLISNACKCFSSILCARLIKFLERNDYLVEEQNGFRKGRSCIDLSDHHSVYTGRRDLYLSLNCSVKMTVN